MSALPIAETVAEALDPARPAARTIADAAQQAGGPVALTILPAPGAFADLAAAEAAYPRLYLDPRFETAFQEGAWRVLVRFWRLAPAAPIGRTALAAARTPIGAARTVREAEAALGAGAVYVRERLPISYAGMRRARARWGPLVERDVAELVWDDGRVYVELSYWRPADAAPQGALTPAERAALAQLAAAPLRSALPQRDPYIGLFERLAPENPDIVLAEEGDGRWGE